jgi:hypothetical protein
LLQWTSQPNESELLVIFGMDSKLNMPTDFYEALVLHLRGDNAGLEAWQRKREARGQSARLELIKQLARNTWCMLNGEGVVEASGLEWLDLVPQASEAQGVSHSGPEASAAWGQCFVLVLEQQYRALKAEGRLNGFTKLVYKE